ncbi:MAG: hypothetical protein U9R48_10465 [Chloroflexota bacterium]|nr:hypothetical protein [Chloroflexota bacterium]
MKRVLRVLSVVAILSLVVASSVSADWSDTWVSSFQVMNLGDTETTITIEYYQEDGTPLPAATHTKSVAVGSSVNIYQPSVLDLPEGFKGAAVVSAGSPIAAIGSEQVTYEDGSIGNSQYTAFSSADVGTSFYLPNVNKDFGAGGWSSRITIQNATADQVDVDITFYNNDASVAVTDTVLLEGNGSTTLWQEDCQSLSSGWLGSAVVDATGNVAVIVDVMSADGRLETYNGFSEGATTMYLPTLLLGFGANSWNTSFQVLNVSPNTADVTMTYYTAGEISPAKTVTATLGQYESLNRYQPTLDSDLGAGWIGSVVVESTEPVVAVGSQSSGASGTRLASIYNGVAAGTAEAVLPTVLRYFGASNFVTSFQIMNVGGSAASVTVEYYEPGNPTPVKTVDYDGVDGNPDPIDPFNSINRYQPNDDEGLEPGWRGSVRVTSDQPVVVLGSQHGLAREGDAVGQYNGIPVTP